MPTLVRQRAWRTELIAWARAVRGEPYIWGRTDCATLVGQALRIQFGKPPFPHLFNWYSAMGAARAWCELRHGGLVHLCESAGARSVLGRQRHWPMGAILVLNEEHGKLPAFGVSMAPFVVRSSVEDGVQWCEPVTVAPHLESAWVFEKIIVKDNDNG